MVKKAIVDDNSSISLFLLGQLSGIACPGMLWIFFHPRMSARSGSSAFFDPNLFPLPKGINLAKSSRPAGLQLGWARCGD